MSRVTVEDCLKKVEGYFELAHLASKRAVQLSNGTPSLITSEQDKPEKQLGKKEKSTVTALREIASGIVDKDFFNKTSSEEFEEELNVNDWIRTARAKNEMMQNEKI